MDYLSGRDNNAGLQDNTNKTTKIVKKQESYLSKLEKTLLVCLDPDQQAMICEKFLNPEIVAVLQDKDLMDCINAFFKNNLNISETSRNAFLHRNTLIYRIEKIYNKTGLNIRKFDDAITFKMLIFIYKKHIESTVEDEK